MNSLGKVLLIVSFSYFMLMFNSCVDIVNPKLDKSDLAYQLVVEGKVTDETGPFKVRLSKSGPVYTYETSNSFKPLSDADVHISDNKGNDFQLNPVQNGWYETRDKNLKGVPGISYTLHITEKDGTKYESTPVFMPDVPPIDSIYYKEVQRTHIVDKTVSQEEWLNILLNTQATGDRVEYFKWEFEETWEFNMPEYIEVIKTIPVNIPGCEGCHIDSIYYKIVSISPDQLHCWVSDNSKSILVKSTAANLSAGIERFPLTSLGPEDDRLSIRYSILVKQYVLNKELYDFFNRLRELNETNGGMFDKIPAPLYGNIQSVTGNKKALGFFFASAVKSKRIFINNRDIHVKTGHSAYSECGWSYMDGVHFGDYFYGTILAPDRDAGEYVFSHSKYCTDCRERGTGVKPDFW